MGVLVQGCQEFANDLAKIFEEYWLGADSKILPVWPPDLNTEYNLNNPMHLGSNENAINLYLASSPKSFAPGKRENDLDAIISAIDTSKKILKFAIMDYSPTSLYLNPNVYWPIIDDALRNASLRGVKLQLLFSIWNHTNPNLLQYWKSLNQLNNIIVKCIKLPESPFSPAAPNSRVAHSKYIVTENKGYITTSNCAADYFLYTGGVSITLFDSPSTLNKLESIFNRDWNSLWTFDVPNKI